jgi:mannose-1-phosphate guanylyltransferase
MNLETNIYTVIMAGGIGSRFWPSSRTARPKQFIDILGTGESLMQMTWQRARRFSKQEQILVLTNQLYQNLVAEHLPEISKTNILTEPARNNTAPCIAYAAFKLYQKDPEAIMVILPADHLILKEDKYAEKIQTAVDFVAKNEALVTLGIQPTRPDTGYGYIQFTQNATQSTDKGRAIDTAINVLPVKSFKEKPDLVTAERYLNSRQYLWNAGIFIWKAKDVISGFKKYQPDLYALFEGGMPYYNTDQENAFIEQHYKTSPKISIDYALMEKADNVFTVPADIGWSDLGTWASLWDVKQKDDAGNVLISDQHMELSQTKGCIISKDPEKLAVIDGLTDYIVIDQKDVLLIYPKSKEQDIKHIIAKLEQQKEANRYL